DTSLLTARRLRAAEHHERAGNVDRATELAREVLDARPDPRTRARAQQLIAEIAYGQSFPSAITLLESAVNEPGADAAALAGLELHLAFAALATMDLETSLVHARRAERLVSPETAPGLVSEILATRVYLEAIGHDSVDRSTFERALSLEDWSRESPIQVRPSQYAASLDMLFGRLETARATFTTLLTSISDAGEEHELP